MAERSLVVVAYDISDDKRRTHVAQVLLRYGGRVEASVYELWLTTREIEKVWHELTKLVRQGDLVRCYIICDGCVKRVRSCNVNAPHDDIVFFG